MPEWLVNLLIGLITAVLGFVGGFFAKTYLVKSKQKIIGNNNNQTNEVKINEK